MARSASFKDRKIYEVVSKELIEFTNLIKGHQKLLEAIGRL